MQRIEVTESTPVIASSTVATMLSVEGSQCRLYMGEAPTDQAAGHLVSAGYQMIVPAGLDVYATSVMGGTSVVVGPFGV